MASRYLLAQRMLLRGCGMSARRNASTFGSSRPMRALADDLKKLNEGQLYEHEDGQTVVDEFDDDGFLVNGVYMHGPIIALPTKVFLWNVRNWSQITPESLTLVTHADPPIDILLVGCGPNHQLLPESLIRAIGGLGVSLEPMTTASAVGTFNVLNAENRRVAAALFPGQRNTTENRDDDNNELPDPVK